MNQQTTLFEKFKLTGKHGIIYAFGTAIQKAITFILLPLYTTRFTPSEYGILGLITMTGAIIETIFVVGMNYGLLRSYYDYDNERDRRATITTALCTLLISTSILAFLGIFFSKYLSTMLFNTAEYRIHFIVLICASVFNILNIVPFVVFRVKMKSWQFIVFQVSFLLLGIVAIIYLVNYRNLGILGALFGQLIISFITTFVLYIYIRKEIVFRFLKVEFKKMLLLGLPLVPANVSVFIFTGIDRYFLNYYSTTSELGLYNLANNFGNIINVLLATPISLIWPVMYLSVKDHDDAEEFYSRALTYGLFISIFLFLFFALLAKEALKIFSNESFWAAYRVIPILILTYAIWSLRKIINVAVILKRKTTATAVIEFIGAAINIGLNFLLIPKFGMMGAGYATFITFFIVVVVTLLYNKRLMNLNYEWFRIIKLLLVAVAIFLLGYFVIIDNLVFSIVFKLVIVFLFPFLLFFTKFYTRGEIQQFKKIFIKLGSKFKR